MRELAEDGPEDKPSASLFIIPPVEPEYDEHLLQNRASSSVASDAATESRGENLPSVSVGERSASSGAGDMTSDDDEAESGSVGDVIPEDCDINDASTGAFACTEDLGEVGAPVA